MLNLRTVAKAALFVAGVGGVSAPSLAWAQSATEVSDPGVTVAILIVIAIVVVLAAFAAGKALADYTSRRYNWPMVMNWWNLLHFIGAGLGLFVASFAGPVAGLVVFGGLWSVVLIVNIMKTNLLAGLVMTLIQPFVVAVLWVIYGVVKAKAEGRRI